MQAKPRQLYPVLRQQRLNAQTSSDETSTDAVKPARDSVRAARPGQRGTGRAAGRPQKRIDLYLNETGYPQSRTTVPGHEQEELHSRRREHLAPTPPDATNDALSGLVDAVAKHSKVSRPPPRRRFEGAPRRSADGQAPFQARPGNTDGYAPREGERERPRLPGLRDRQSRFKTQSGPGGNRGGPASTNRRPGGRPGSGPGGMRKRREQSKPTLVPAKMFDPAPTSVVGQSGYVFASTLPKKGEVPKVQMNMHRAQWRLQKRDVEKSHLGSGTAAAVLKGDWQSYIAPVFKQTAELENKKSAHGIANEMRNETLDRATRTVVMNPSMRLHGKFQVTSKVASLL